MGELVLYFFGALVGVLWPPASPGWARWQKRGLVCGGVALLACAVAVACLWFETAMALVTPAFGVALVAFLGYMVIGNVCRKYHEGRMGEADDEGNRKE